MSGEKNDGMKMKEITETNTKRNESVETWSRVDEESQLNELK